METHQQDVERLISIDAFIRYMEHVYSQRELAIRDLRGASRDTVLTLSGRIQAFDEILTTYDWERIRDLIAASRNNQNT